MKVAVLGKGGSGKSTVSWLLTNFLTQNQNKKVLAIDSDHNMDLSHCLKAEINEQTPFFYKVEKEFRALAGMPPVGPWREYLSSQIQEFSFDPFHHLLSKYSIKIQPNLDLIILGLGDESIMYTDKCSHGLAAPLKYLLPTLKMSENSFLVLDSVAGADMLNYGLFFGCDLIVTVVEGNINSIKVANQLRKLSAEQGLDMYFLVNKYDPNNQMILEFVANNQNSILGYIPVDISLLSYEYSNLQAGTVSSLDNIVDKMMQIKLSQENQLERLRNFETKKTILKQKLI
jgi:CO dehydrogenase maturation factor